MGHNLWWKKLVKVKPLFNTFYALPAPHQKQVKCHHCQGEHITQEEFRRFSRLFSPVSFILIAFNISGWKCNFYSSEKTETYLRLMLQRSFLLPVKAKHFGRISTHKAQPVHNETWIFSSYQIRFSPILPYLIRRHHNYKVIPIFPRIFYQFMEELSLVLHSPLSFISNSVLGPRYCLLYGYLIHQIIFLFIPSVLIHIILSSVWFYSENDMSPHSFLTYHLVFSLESSSIVKANIWAPYLPVYNHEWDFTALGIMTKSSNPVYRSFVVCFLYWPSAPSSVMFSPSPFFLFLFLLFSLWTPSSCLIL